jgi:hypothetical protein
MTVHCATCGHQWTLAIALPMELGRFTRTLRGYALVGCPKCGAEGDAVLCGPSKKSEGDD